MGVAQVNHLADTTRLRLAPLSVVPGVPLPAYVWRVHFFTKTIKVVSCYQPGYP